MNILQISKSSNENYLYQHGHVSKQQIKKKIYWAVFKCSILKTNYGKKNGVLQEFMGKQNEPVLNCPKDCISSKEMICGIL